MGIRNADSHFHARFLDPLLKAQAFGMTHLGDGRNPTAGSNENAVLASDAGFGKMKLPQSPCPSYGAAPRLHLR